MAIQFRKSKSFGPMRMTLGKTGVSTSVGFKGFRLTFGRKGTTMTTGIPGTGIYNRQKIGDTPQGNTYSDEYGWNKKGLSKTGKLLLIIFVGIPVTLFVVFLFLAAVVAVSKTSMAGAGCLLFGVPLIIWLGVSFLFHKRIKQ